MDRRYSAIYNMPLLDFGVPTVQQAAQVGCLAGRRNQILRTHQLGAVLHLLVKWQRTGCQMSCLPLCLSGVCAAINDAAV